MYCKPITVEAKTKTQAETQNELNKAQSLGWEILEATIDPETFVYQQSYPTIYINPKPPLISELNPEVLKLARTAENGYTGDNEDGNIFLSLSSQALWITPANEGGDWGPSTKSFILSETEPSNPNNNDYWFQESTSKLYEYVTDTWIEKIQNIDFEIVAQQSELPIEPELGDLIIFTAYDEPMLGEYIYQSNPELFLVMAYNGENVLGVYCYIHSAQDAIKANLRFEIEGEDKFKEGWNRIEDTDENTGYPSSVSNINYSDVPTFTNASFGGELENFNKMSPYLGYFYRSTPWLGQ